MNTKLIIFIILTLSITACIGVRKVYRLINQKEKFIWTNTYDEKNYVLTIDSSKGKWFTGRIIIDFNDTLYLEGFEKGNVHPTSVHSLLNDTTHSAFLGYVFIDTKGYTADTVIIDNKSDSIKQLPINFILHKLNKQ